MAFDDERGKSLDQIALEDAARECDGTSMKITRFTDQEDDPKLKDKKKRAEELCRALSLLEEMLRDPEYKQAWTKANDRIVFARNAVLVALEDNARLIVKS